MRCWLLQNKIYITIFSLSFAIIVVIYCQFSFSAPNPLPTNPYHISEMNNKGDLQETAEQFRNLRNVKGHFEGGEWNELVDPQNSSKQLYMKFLGEQLGVKGTPANLVFELMGEPDEITSDLNNPFQSPGFMPGPVIPGKEGDQAVEVVYLLYYWRGRHDFMYFRMDSGKEIIIDHSWHYDYE